MDKKSKEDLIGTAAQIVYEYPGWGCEHVSDMYDCVPAEFRSKYSYYDLEDMCYLIQGHKNSGKSYHEAIKAVA